MDELLKKISITEEGPEKNKLLDELSSLHLLNKKREEERLQEIKKKEELELRQLEDIDLQKYKSLFEKRVKEFVYECPRCGSLCENHKNYPQYILFCTNDSCYHKKYSDYDYDDEVGVEKEKCKRKIIFN